mmetsp:Transcript_13975/g.39549  ORF Transcript_13975/g.39549 Transcript_13975/m.39549 type:complete len:166 (+) Transcript_13975:316-813(+)|eukprot:CAMPEP_0117653398 /NCGR_PEP_ID=MMETSP0804-20121206/3165_1 /TAXON_ID=1074897 /ORGANISM="Tetraselmis astigmatica, Strain CCMP880" /LENGTH=165 /DNA_ID=CAMNT_0005459561 /DNA_START=377 /DNA_END=874 /DNA_ORIENTATION=+
MGILTTFQNPTVPVGLRTGVAARGRSPVAVLAMRTQVNAVDVALVHRSALTSYPGEDAPRTGKRVVPPLAESASDVSMVTSGSTSHRGLSSEEYYARFPTMARASCPLAFSPLPIFSEVEPPRGPGTGRRVRPTRVEEDKYPHLAHQPSDPAHRLKMVQQRRSQM